MDKNKNSEELHCLSKFWVWCETCLLNWMAAHLAKCWRHVWPSLFILPVPYFSTLLTHVRICGPYSNYLVWLFLDSILYYHNSIHKSQRMSMAASKKEKYLKIGWGWLGLNSIVYCLPNTSEAHEFYLQHSITAPKEMPAERPSLIQPVPNL